MLTSALRWYVCNSSFQHFQQCLLNTFTGNITRDRHVLTCLTNLVDLINIDHATLGGFHVEVSSMEELKQKILNIFTDVSGFC